MSLRSPAHELPVPSMGFPRTFLYSFLERIKDSGLAAGPFNEPATLPCHHFRLVCKEWAATGLKVLTKVRVRDDWAQLSAPHLQRLLQRCPHIGKVDISFGYGQEPWVETAGSLDMATGMCVCFT
jgi:hypothetical protein